MKINNNVAKKVHLMSKKKEKTFSFQGFQLRFPKFGAFVLAPSQEMFWLIQPEFRHRLFRRRRCWLWSPWRGWRGCWLLQRVSATTRFSLGSQLVSSFISKTCVKILPDTNSFLHLTSKSGKLNRRGCHNKRGCTTSLI